MLKHKHDPQDPQEEGEVTRHPNGRSGGRFLRFAAIPAAALALGTGVALVVPSGPASAHTGTLNVTAECVNGQEVLTFSGQASNVPESGPGHTATFTVGEVQPAGATVSDAPSTVVGNSAYSFKLTVPGDTTYAQATAFLEWGDGVKADPQGTINLKGDCTPPATEVTPAAPTVTTPDCDNPNITVTPSNQPGVIWNPAGATTLTPGQSVTYTATPGQDIVFPQGAQTSFPFTNNFNVEDCTPSVTEVTPALTVTTPDCDNTDKVVSDNSSIPNAVNWSPALPFTVHPGQTQVFTASPQNTFGFPAGAQTSFTVTNDFNVKDCTPPSVGGYNGTTSGTCKIGTGTGYVDKDFGSPVAYTLKVGSGKGKWAIAHFTVRPGQKGSASRPGNPGAKVLLYAKGKLLSASVLKKDCGTPPPPPCQQNCNPTPPSAECVPPNNTWFDNNHNGVVDTGECVPTGRVETGLGDDLSNIVGSSTQPQMRGAGWTEAGTLLMAGMTLMLGSLLLLRRRSALQGLVRRR